MTAGEAVVVMGFYGWMLLAIALGPLLLLQAIKWLVVPLILRRKQVTPLKLNRVPTQVERLTPELQAFLGKAISDFRGLDFSVVANLYSAGAATGMDAVMLLFVRPDRGDVARAFAITGKTARSMTFLCSTELPDGRRWTTISNRDPKIFPPMPQTFSLTCSWVSDIAALYEFHRRRLADAGVADTTGIVPAPGQEIDFLQREEDLENRWLVRRGYRFQDTAAGVWRFTVKGAYLCVWKMLNPIKWWRLRARDRKAQREWQRLGMGQPVLTPPLQVEIVEHASPLATDSIHEPGAVLPYTTEPAPGEMGLSEHNGVTTIKIARGKTVVFFQRNVLSLIWLAFMLYVTFMLGRRAWQIHQLFQVPFFRLIGQGFWLCGALAIVDIVQLGFRWVRHRRPVTLRASHEGLAFDGIQSRPRRGTIARGEIGALVGAFGNIRLSGRTYKLVVRHGGRTLPIVLAEDRPKAEVDEMAARLRLAMGIALADS